MEWKKTYKEKILTADEAILKIKSGDKIVSGHAIAEPTVLLQAIVKNKEKFKNLELAHMVPMQKCDYVSENMKGRLRHNAIFVGAGTRDAVNDGRADYTPCFFSEVPKLFKEGYMEIDTALVHLSPPDKHGYCSFGASVDYTKPAAEHAKLVIAEINEYMPRTLGDSFIHVSKIDYLVDATRPLVELQPPKITDIEKKIGKYCASLVEDGSTLQLGIGAIPDAALQFLTDKKDLGIHSEMISDGVMNLVKAGVITNKKKSIHKDKTIVNFLMGTRELYDFVDDNPSIEMYPANYTNDPTVIMKNYKMVTINSCLQVDLMGQVVSEMIGDRQISGVGGQVDFVRGSVMAEGGKSIIAMPSTAARGKVSRIVANLTEGAAVTTSRNDVQYIITEYGIAELKGKTLKQRARLLIEIAHPDFRDSLVKEWEKRFFDKY
ncbi:MAG: 4-hydroxybutyrate CoA-transferase [Alkaliphilus sp.]|nr:MAG: 4-hydroxybutyrate CoA-transferase [Alkaliphilus sp.]